MNLKELTPTLRVVLILGLVFMILGSVVALTLVGKDSAGVYAFGGSVLIGLGIMAGVTGQVASNTNGNTSKLLEMVDSAQRQNAMLLSLMTPASPAAEQKVIELATTPTPVSAPPLLEDTVMLPRVGVG